MPHIVTCGYCGKRLDGDLRRRYCTKSCKYSAKYERTKSRASQCPKCGGPFFTKPGGGRDRCNACAAMEKPKPLGPDLTKTCPNCGCAFKVRHKLSKYCSTKCRERASYESRLARGPKCPLCGGPHWAQGNNPRPMCNKCYESKKGHGVTWKGQPVTCRDCRATFLNNKDKKESHCSQCRHARMKERAASKGSCALNWCDSPQFCKGWCSRHYWEQHRGAPFTTPVPCDGCGEPLQYTRQVGDSEPTQRFHSRCKPRGARFIPDRERLEIYERDEYVCQICDGAVVRRDGDWDPWEASLDHIVPRSMGDAPDHSPENLRTVHSICNALRGPASLSDIEVVARLKDWEAANA